MHYDGVELYLHNTRRSSIHLCQSDLRYELIHWGIESSSWTSVLHYGIQITQTYISSSEEKKHYIVRTVYVISHDNLML
jgi:hypothetical protein